MLRALQKVDPKQREGILAGLAMDFLPDPKVVVGADRGSVPEAIRTELIKELGRTLRLEMSSDDNAVKRKVLDYISEQLRETVLRSAKISDVRERVGQKGLLSPDAYDVSYGDDFRDVFDPLGTSRGEVELCIRKPDFVEHIRPEEFGQDSGSAISVSLFVRRWASSDPYDILVLATRRGGRLTVGSAWRLFHSDICIDDLINPMRCLRGLLTRYGVPIRVGDRTDTFFLYETIPVVYGQQASLFAVEPRGTDRIYGQFLVRRGSFSANVAVAFAVNLTSYVADMKSHGVAVRAKR